MTPTPEVVLHLFRQHSPQTFSERDLTERLGLDVHGRRALRKTLRTLCRDGTLRRTRHGRYLLAQSRPSVTGIVEFRSSGQAELVLESGETLFVPAQVLRGALPGDRVRGELLPPRPGSRRAAEVKEILAHGPGQILGTLRHAGRGAYLEPREPELFPYYLAISPENTADAAEGDLVIAEISEFPLGGARVAGRVVEVLGAESDPDAEVAAVAYHHGLRLEFPEAVMREVQRVPAEVRKEDVKNRVDLRKLPFVTIDGEDARDFDDAVLVEALPRGGFRLRVAIADVSHYVPEGSALDAEALARGNSVYFPGRVLPMLPHELSNGICSLNPDVDRLVLCADLRISKDGNILASEFCEGVIRSHARLTYTEVFEGVSSGRPVRGLGDPKPAVELCEILGRRRRERGSLDFDIPEAQVVLDKTGEVVDVVRRGRNLAHRLVEEFMIAANEAVARYFEGREHPTVFRVHEHPDPEKIKAFSELAGALGLRLRPEDHTSPQALARFVEAVAGEPSARSLHALLLRSMKQAFYDIENIGHFGLATEEYLHFTSPIRRYPDLLVHRLLRPLLRGGRTPEPEEHDRLSERLSEMAVQASERERLSIAAEREVLSYYRARLMTHQIGEVHAGQVAAVVPFGIFVEIDRPFVDGLVHVQNLGGDFFEFHEETQRLVGRETGVSFALGDRVQVRVVDSSVSRRQVSFELVAGGARQSESPPRRPAPSVKKRERPVRPKKGSGRPGRRRR
jgi:ribonuclease R